VQTIAVGIFANLPARELPDIARAEHRRVIYQMKSRFLPLVLFSTLFTAGQSRAIDADLGRFITAKQQQIRDLSGSITNMVPAVVWSFFDAVRVDDWETASRLANRISSASLRYTQATNDAMTPALQTLIWPPISESWGTYDQFHNWNNRWLHRFGREIIQSIPRGSIYFGGTDPGRFVISALIESQVDGKPFFVLTQNQIADATYVDYLRSMYGKKLCILTTNDLQQAFKEYLTNVQARLKHDRTFPDEPRQLKPGETVRIDKDDRIQVTGAVAVMELSGLIAKKIFDDNPGREFFVEESYPLDWMYPYLVPHGLIFQLNRQPRAEISGKDAAADQEYWKKLTDEMFGGWLDEKTSVKEICDFSDKYGLGKHLEGYPGDKSFAENESARKTFSKLRSSIGGLYAWRAEHAKDADERNRMYRAADLAFRQSYAICPISPEATWRYVNLLSSRKRFDDAILIVKTSLHLDPDNQQLKDLLSQLMKYQ
jgi:hypothetical protein